MRYRMRSLALLAVAMLVAACATDAPPPAPEPPADDVEPAPDEPDEHDEPPAPAPSEPDVSGDSELTVFFARSTTDQIWVEPAPVAVDPTLTADGEANALLTTLFRATPADPELFTAVPSGVEVVDVTRSDGVLIVSVSDALRATSGSSTQEVAFANQLAHTAAQIDGVSQVRLEIDGAPITDLWGHLDWSLPFAPDPFALTPIVISEPTHDATTTAGTVVARGEATVFEATFDLRLRTADDTVREEAVITASAGGPERGTWDHSFTITAPGDYVLEASEIDPSGGEGRAPVVVRRHFTVVAG